MRKRLTLLPALALPCLICLTSHAQIRVVPRPKQVEIRQGRFLITPSTRIVLSPAARESQVAAEMLAEEIESMVGQKPRVTSGTPVGENAIYLVRLSAQGMRHLLATHGLPEDDNLDPEGYVLEATKKRILIAASTNVGVFYGVQTLRQLLAPDGKRVACPALMIKDWPSMRWRGVQDDISRGPIPTLEYMKRQVRTLAEYKVNLFSLYMEGVFDYASLPLIASKEAAITAAQLKELVAYASKYHVVIVPEQQTFGHLHHVLKYDLYSDLAETPHGHVLAPVQEGSYALVRSMYAELAPLFPGPFFHVGADETFELGRGQSKARAEASGTGRLYMEHLSKVAEILEPFHKRLLFWGDIALRYPELLRTLPKNLIADVWSYDPRPAFDEQLQPYRDVGLDIFVSPGANNWNLLFPNLDAAYINIRNLVRDGQKYGAVGALNTTWDDDGEALFDLTWPALVFGAAAAWQPGESSIEAFRRDFDWTFYRSDDHSFDQAVMELTRAHALLKRAGLDGATDEVFWLDPFSEDGASYVRKALPVAHDLRLRAEGAIVSLYNNRSKARLHQESIGALLMAGFRLDLLGMKIEFADEINRFYWDAFQHVNDRDRVYRDLSEIDDINGRLQDLRDATTRARELYSHAWAHENRSYWLGNVLVRYDRLANMYQGKIEAIKAARRQYARSSTLPPPEQLGFFLKP